VDLVVALHLTSLEGYSRAWTSRFVVKLVVLDSSRAVNGRPELCESKPWIFHEAHAPNFAYFLRGKAHKEAAFRMLVLGAKARGGIRCGPVPRTGVSVTKLRYRTARLPAAGQSEERLCARMILAK
jgi:hypothetical protein